MRTASLITAALVLLAAGEAAAQVSRTERFVQKWNSPTDALIIDNPVGNVEVFATDEPVITATATRTVTATNADALEAGRRMTSVVVEASPTVRRVRTVTPPLRSPHWSASVSWVIRAPRFLHITILSNTSERIRVANFRGNVTVKNFAGSVLLENVAATTVESINGTIEYDTPRPASNARLSSINGSIHVIVAADSNFRWIGETIKGDFKTTMPVRGSLSGSRLRAAVNAPGGPTIETLSMMGEVFLLRKTTTAAQAQSVRAMKETISQVQEVAERRETRHEIVQGGFAYQTSIGNVSVNEVRGEAAVHTGAGEVNIGTVFGACQVTSGGGPLKLGEIFGPLQARTLAGDVTVDAARDGGSLYTQGGTIRLMYNGGPVRLISGGGDIIVRQTTADVTAEARSGDINISADPESRSVKIDARTAKGNVTLNVTNPFKADVEATILTSNPASHSIRSNVPGLKIRQEQVGGKTRITATGKLNGGGPKVVLQAEEGNIVITGRPPVAARPAR